MIHFQIKIDHYNNVQKVKCIKEQTLQCFFIYYYFLKNYSYFKIIIKFVNKKRRLNES